MADTSKDIETNDQAGGKYSPDKNGQKLGDDMHFGLNEKNQKDNLSEYFMQMSAGHLEAISTRLSKMKFDESGWSNAYFNFALLILVSLVQSMQRSVINFMVQYVSDDDMKNLDPSYNIREAVPDLLENFGKMTGDGYSIFYAFAILFTGTASDLFPRKQLLCASQFGWCLSVYLMAYCSSFYQLMILRLIMSLFNAFSGPCSYSLITDWIPPEQRTLAYAVYALGVQFGGPISFYNMSIIDWLGWSAAFQFEALVGFVVLGICLLSFDEPERGRFDIAHSVVNNPDESIKSGSQANGAYDLSDNEETRRRLDIRRESPDESIKMKSIVEYFKALKELFVNDTAIWILVAACLRTQQGIAMTLFTNDYFRIYPENESQYNFLSQLAGIIGTFICTLGTAIISDRYDNINYMTKAYICIVTTMISIPCCCMIYLCNSNFWVSMTGIFIEYLLSTGWGQPAIGILSTVCDAQVRGTAISIFFFVISIFGVVAPYGYLAIQDHYGLDPIEEPQEFGQLIACCTIIPCIIAIPCFYIAGVKYSWYKFHEAMFVLDVWGEMEQFFQDEITLKRFNQMTGDPAEPANLSVSVDWKLIQKQRKIKTRNLKQTLEQGIHDKFKQINDRKKKLNHISTANDLKKSKVMAVLPDDMTKKEFPDQNSRSSSIQAVQGEAPIKQASSYDHPAGGDYSLLIDYQRPLYDPTNQQY